MPTISKPKTLNEIEALASNEQAHVLVLDAASKLKKLLIVNKDGQIPSELINLDAVTADINKIKAEKDNLENKSNASINELSNEIKLLQKQIKELVSSNTEKQATIDSLSSEINKIKTDLSTPVKSEEKPVKKTRKAKKSVESAVEEPVAEEITSE